MCENIFLTTAKWLRNIYKQCSELIVAKIKLLRHLPLMLASLAMGLGVFINVNHQNKQPVEQAEAAVDITDYTSCNTAYNNNNASSLLSALRTITSPGHAGSYDDLWTTYVSCYKRADGKIFDYYSSKTNYAPGGSAQGANYDEEGDSYNREHSIPKSWWGGSTSNQGADPYIVVPTDGYVNNARSNYTFGYVASATKTFSNSKLGSGSSSYGYTGTVFEPDDSVKGDFARIYFYAIAKYSGASGWTSGDGSKNFSGSDNTNNGLTAYAVKLFTKWHHDDPVSDWEVGLNDRVSAIQGNRNPFIDHPEYADVLWGKLSGGTMYGGTTPINHLTITKTSVNLTVDGTTTISATSSDSSTITWSSDDTDVVTVSPSISNSGVNVTLTAAGAGTATITASATVDDTVYTRTCSVEVTSSGGSGGSGNYYSIAVSDAPGSYSTTSFTADGISYGCSNINNTSSSGNIQWKSGAGFLYNTTAISGITNISIASGNTGSFTGTIYTGNSAVTSDSGTSYSITGGSSVDISGSPSYFRIKAGTVSQGAKSRGITISYSSTAKTLTSISVETAPTKTTYTAGEYFNPTGLVITRNYSDSTSDTYTYANHTSEFSFSPSTSVALTTEDDTVEINYGGHSAFQSITVNAPVITSISASVSKTFYVGETISASDITVKDNYNNVLGSFTFANDGYSFKYEDGSSGGVLTSKTFSNAVSASGKTCSLTVQVQRKEYVPVSTVSDTLTNSDFVATDTSYKNFSNVSKTSDARYSGNSAKGNNAIQLRSDTGCGIWTTASGGKVKSISVTWESHTVNGRTLNIYLSNSAYSGISGSVVGTIVYGTSTSYTVTGDYAYVAVKSNSGAMYLTNITFTYGADQSPENIANYIMYADTDNQCKSKLSTAIDYLGDLSSTDRSYFASSDDYVIKTARERLNAWATHEGKTIDYTNAELNGSNAVALFGLDKNNNAITLIIIISMLSATSIGACIFIRKKHEIK